MNIIFTPRSREDRNSVLYSKAILKEANNRGLQVNIVTINNQEELNNLLDLDRFIVLEPCEFTYDKTHHNNLEKNITARVVREICNELRRRDDSLNNVLIVNRSELIGRPLIDMLLDDDFTVSVCHSKTDKDTLIKYGKIADIVVLGTGHDLNYLDLINAHVIDISNDYYNSRSYCKNYVGMKEIGRLTVDMLLNQI